MSIQSMKSADLYHGRSRYHKGHQYSIGIVAAIIFVEDRIDQLADIGNGHGNTST